MCFSLLVQSFSSSSLSMSGQAVRRTRIGNDSDPNDRRWMKGEDEQKDGDSVMLPRVVR